MPDEPQDEQANGAAPEEQPNEVAELQARVDECEKENDRLYNKVFAARIRIRNLAKLARSQRRFIRDMVDATRIDDWLPGDPHRELVEDGRDDD